MSATRCAAGARSASCERSHDAITAASDHDESGLVATSSGLRIYVCGAHSSGKTTLVTELSQSDGNLLAVEEVARRVIQEMSKFVKRYLT